MNESTPNQAIRVRGLSLWYGNFQALIDVNLDIERGKVTGLIGPSGCGKTTLLRCFNRINERIDGVRTSGEVQILDHNSYSAETDLTQLRKKVGMVFQRPNPLPISVADNILFGLRIHGEKKLSKEQARQVVESALREVSLWDDLADRLNVKATSLSLEQQQKLCIARLLPLKPEILLMDEPCSALDPAATKRIEELIFELRGRYSIIIVTHNMAQARRVADSCIFMLMGEMVEHLRTEDLFLNPKDERTAQYIEGRYG